MEAAYQCHMDKNWEEACKILTKAIKLEKKSATLFRNRSMAYAELGQYEQCLKDAERAVKVWTPLHQYEYTDSFSFISSVRRVLDGAAAVGLDLNRPPRGFRSSARAPRHV